MQKNIKLILGLFVFVLCIVVGSKFLIKKSDELAPSFTVIVAKAEIKAGELITESLIEPKFVHASAVKRQSLYWSVSDVKDSEVAEMNSTQMKKVIGKTANKLFNKGDQISVTGIK